MPEKHY